MSSVDSISLRSYRRSNPLGMVTWVDVGGGCYRVVSEHGSPLELDVRCVGQAFMSFARVLIILVVYVLVAYAWCWSWL